MPPPSSLFSPLARTLAATTYTQTPGADSGAGFWQRPHAQTTLERYETWPMVVARVRVRLGLGFGFDESGI